MNNIYCGDACDVMNEHIQDESVHLIITSPPYNVGIDYDNHNDSLDYKSYLSNLFKVWECCYQKLVKGGRICINVSTVKVNTEYYSLTTDIVNQMRELNLIMRGDILWYKQVCSSRTAWGSWKSPSNPNIIQNYEFVLVFSKETKKLEGDKERIDITKEEFTQYSNAFWHINPESATKIGHPCPYPEELVYRLIKFFSYKGNVVLDPFCGSGTTCVVAKKTGRQYIGIDKSEKYVEIAEKRLKTNEVFKPNHFMKDVKLKTTNKLF
jgi:DNA modification methylase